LVEAPVVVEERAAELLPDESFCANASVPVKANAAAKANVENLIGVALVVDG
jgi:hypothetical protein